MTGAEFRAKYQVGKKLTSQGVRSHLAVRPDGRAVMVHFVEGKSPGEQGDLLGRIDHLPPAQRTQILEIVRVDDTPTVVTEYLQGFDTLEAWLGLPSPSPAEQPETPPAPRDADDPGEFTALFGALPDEPGPPPSVEEKGQRPPAAAGSTPPGPPPEPPADSKVETPPGEFTQLFTPVSDGKPTLVDQPGGTRHDPGQSTRGAGAEGGGQPPSARAGEGPPRLRDTTPEAGASSAPPTPKKPPGELTRLFGVGTDDGVDANDQEQAKPAAGPQHPQREGSADAPHPPDRSKPRVFWKKRQRPGPPLPPLVEQARRPPPKPAPPSDLAPRPQSQKPRPEKQPGQFTKLFGANPESPPTNPPPPNAPQPPPAFSIGHGRGEEVVRPGGPSRDSGDYRRALERLDADVHTPTPPGTPPAAGNAPIQPPATPPPAPYPAPPAAGGPSDFTKVMGGVQVPLPQQASTPPPPPPPAAPAKRHAKGLIVGFSIVFAVLFVLVILLAVLL